MKGFFVQLSCKPFVKRRNILHIVFAQKRSDTSYTSVADVMLIASWSETFLVEERKIKWNTTSIKVTTSFNFFIERHYQQQAEHQKGNNLHGLTVRDARQVSLIDLQEGSSWRLV